MTIDLLDVLENRHLISWEGTEVKYEEITGPRLNTFIERTTIYLEEVAFFLELQCAGIARSYAELNLRFSPHK